MVGQSNVAHEKKSRVFEGSGIMTELKSRRLDSTALGKNGCFQMQKPRPFHQSASMKGIKKVAPRGSNDLSPTKNMEERSQLEHMEITWPLREV